MNLKIKTITEIIAPKGTFIITNNDWITLMRKKSNKKIITNNQILITLLFFYFLDCPEEPGFLCGGLGLGLFVRIKQNCQFLFQ